MEFLKSFHAAKHIQDLVPFQLRLACSCQRVVGRPFPITEVFHKSVFLWIIVDVENQCGKIGIVCDRDSTEAFLEQASSPSISFVDGFSVGVE